MTVSVTRELLERHDKAGPRYTSYPTAPVWSTDFGAADYRDALRELASSPDDELSVYLHLPFCAKQCHYCGCNTAVMRDRNAVDRYLDRVEREIELVVGQVGAGRRVVQLHWGGGTPNFLKPHQIERAMGLFRQHFLIDSDAEVSLEIDPRVGPADQPAHLHSIGFNRISMGIQDFDDSVQRAIGRRQSRERTLRVYRACRDAGFESVNVDLVYGLPGQTTDSLAQTLRIVTDEGPDRIACFGYAHVPWVRPNQKLVDTTRLVTGYEKFELFVLCIETFEAAGYDWIGIDHFARREDELAVALREKRLHRNFMGYTTNPAPHMLAFGMSGIGEVCGRYVQNASDLEAWGAALDSGELPVARGHRLSDGDRLRRLAIVSLMCNGELPYAITVDDFGLRADDLLSDEFARMKPYEDEGFVVFEEDRLRITELGRHFARNVCMELDAYLERGAARPLFSRTV